MQCGKSGFHRFLCGLQCSHFAFQSGDAQQGVVDLSLCCRHGVLQNSHSSSNGNETAFQRIHSVGECLDGTDGLGGLGTPCLQGRHVSLELGQVGGVGGDLRRSLLQRLLQLGDALRQRRQGLLDGIVRLLQGGEQCGILAVCISLCQADLLLQCGNGTRQLGNAGLAAQGSIYVVDRIFQYNGSDVSAITRDVGIVYKAVYSLVKMQGASRASVPVMRIVIRPGGVAIVCKIGSVRSATNVANGKRNTGCGTAGAVFHILFIRASVCSAGVEVLVILACPGGSNVVTKRIQRFGLSGKLGIALGAVDHAISAARGGALRCNVIFLNGGGRRVLQGDRRIAVHEIQADGGEHRIAQIATRKRKLSRSVATSDLHVKGHRNDRCFGGNTFHRDHVERQDSLVHLLPIDRQKAHLATGHSIGKGQHVRVKTQYEVACTKHGILFQADDRRQLALCGGIGCIHAHIGGVLCIGVIKDHAYIGRIARAGDVGQRKVAKFIDL